MEITDDAVPTITGYANGQTAPTPKGPLGFKPGELMGSVSGELGLRKRRHAGFQKCASIEQGKAPGYWLFLRDQLGLKQSEGKNIGAGSDRYILLTVGHVGHRLRVDGLPGVEVP